MLLLNLEEEELSAMSAMEASLDKQDDGYVGPFWYSPETNSLFGTVLTLASDAEFYKSSVSNVYVRTGNALHKSIWKKEQFRKPKNPLFTGDYKMKPRGRVFQDNDGTYIVFTGDWIDKHPEAKEQIMFEFQLPEQSTVFRKSTHWDIGHGWSSEL